jgi:hypothetical protein
MPNGGQTDDDASLFVSVGAKSKSKPPADTSIEISLDTVYGPGKKYVDLEEFNTSAAQKLKLQRLLRINAEKL